jgi:hypothetical protein
MPSKPIEDLPNAPADPAEGAFLHIVVPNGGGGFNSRRIALADLIGLALAQVPPPPAPFSAEDARDVLGAALEPSGAVSITVNDAGDKIVIGAPVPPAPFTAEDARDAIGAALTPAGFLSIAVNDAGDQISIGLKSVTLTQAAYDALAVKDADTLYFIPEA